MVWSLFTLYMNAKTLLPLNMYVFFSYREDPRFSLFLQMGIYSLSVQTSCTCGTLKLKRFAKTFSSYLFIPCSVLWLSGTDLMTYFLYWKGWLSQGCLHWHAFIYLFIYVFIFIASDDNFSSLNSRPFSNVVLLMCWTKLIELDSTLARQ